MRVEVLSEHPDAMLTDAGRERRRPADEQRAKVESLREDRWRARSQGRWLTWLRLGFAVSGARRESDRLHIASALPTGREEATRAGRDAERRVSGKLGEVLDDEWMLFRGYCNARGEIDALLVGPRGVFAIEEKYRSVRVFVRGDSWTAEKIDRYGRTFGGRFALRDGKGRSPARQVKEPAESLAEWLRRNGRGTRVTAVVLLSHPSAKIEVLERPGVQVKRSVSKLVSFIEGSQGALDAGRRAEIERLVRRDHAFHKGKRARS
jgi:hypothetical protein